MHVILFSILGGFRATFSLQRLRATSLICLFILFAQKARSWFLLQLVPLIISNNMA